MFQCHPVLLFLGNCVVSALGRLQGIFASLTGADSHGILQRENKNLSVADFSRVCRFANSLNDLLALIVENCHFNLDLGEQINAVLRASVALHLTLLTPGAPHVRYSQSHNPNVRQRLLHVLKAVRADNRVYHFHGPQPASISNELKATRAASQNSRTLYSAPAGLSTTMPKRFCTFCSFFAAN